MISLNAIWHLLLFWIPSFDCIGHKEIYQSQLIAWYFSLNDFDLYPFAQGFILHLYVVSNKDL